MHGDWSVAGPTCSTDATPLYDPAGRTVLVLVGGTVDVEGARDVCRDERGYRSMQFRMSNPFIELVSCVH